MLESTAKCFRTYDKFGQKPGFKVSYEGGNSYISYMGALCSVVFFTISVIFLYSKILILANVSQITVMSTYEINALTHNDTFTAADGLFLAAALTYYNTDTEPINEPRHGELTIEKYGWGSLENQQEVLTSRRCTDDELGLADGAKFPLTESFRQDVSTWRDKFVCVDEAGLSIYGDYSSSKAEQLVVKFTLCDATQRNDCYSKEETLKWLQRKFVVLLYRQIRFD